jgi:LacI family gluconate utilization system Gnt-I transcriptional repressor
MKLPGVRNLAVAFGVSEITIRNAVKRLCRDGLLAARPRVGLTVCASSGRSWRGVVVGLRSAHDSGMYYANVMEGAIASELMRGGWLFARMEWPDGSDGADIVGSLKCFSPALVVASFPPPAMLKALERSGLPFVQIWGEKTSAKARLAARPCADVALAELARRLAVHGVRKVISAYQLPKGIVCGAVLKKAGFSVRPMHIPPLNDYIPPENVQRAALETFDRMLSKGPLDADAIVFNDDYLAAGALSAFERHGVRMPEDIRLATVSNYGLGPVHFCPLTRLEVNPAHYGLEVAENLLKILDGKSVPRQMDLEATFIKGETA